MSTDFPTRTRRSGAVRSRVLPLLLALTATLVTLGSGVEAAAAATVSSKVAQATQRPPAPPAPAAVPTGAPTAAPTPGSALTPPPGTFPNLPLNSGVGRRVIYSNSQQRVWLVEQNGAIMRSYLVSGRRGVPRPGTYGVFSKSRHTRSGSVTMQYMVRFARGRSLAIGFHSIPVNRAGRPIQGLNELGQFRSAGCVRQSVADAAFLWDWAPIGTTVVVTP